MTILQKVADYHWCMGLMTGIIIGMTLEFVLVMLIASRKSDED